jgi:hypothetical protein
MDRLTQVEKSFVQEQPGDGHDVEVIPSGPYRTPVPEPGRTDTVEVMLGCEYVEDHPELPSELKPVA